VAGVPDGNGDGWSEIVVGGPGDDSLGADTGMAQLIRGPSGASSVTHFGEVAGDRYGERVAGIGDYDGDGRGDYAVAAPFHTGGISPLLFDDGGRVELRRALDGGLIHGAEGTNIGARLGWGLGGARAIGAGDTNHDGLDDVVYGAPWHDAGGTDLGRTTVRTNADRPDGWDLFGVGLAGTGGVPGIVLDDDPELGASTGIVMTSTAPAAAVAWVHMGVVQTAIPAKGGTLYVNPISSFPLPLSPGPSVVVLAVPPDAALALAPPLLLQLTIPDAGAPQGWSFSRLLRIQFGY
jgi:hypothetical protein